MKNTRKKKNYALRRRIRKTTAALFMAVAVVVAAIPVENMGTMQAKTSGRSTVSFESLYEDYVDFYLGNAGKTITAEYGNYYFGGNSTLETEWKDYVKKTYDDVKASATDIHITANITEGSGDTSLEWTFIYKDKNNSQNGNIDGVILGYNSDRIRDIVTIDNLAYKDAWVITPGALSAFKDIVDKETYEFSVFQSADVNILTKDEVGNYSIPGKLSDITATAKKNGTLIPDNDRSKLELENKHDDGVYKTGSTNTTEKLYTDWYDKSGTLKMYAKAPVQPYISEYFEDTPIFKNLQTKIANYNTYRESVISKIQKSNDSTTLATDIRNDTIELKKQYDEITNPATPITFAGNTVSMASLEKMFCDRVIITYDPNKTIDLLDFELTYVRDRIHYSGVTSDVYYSYALKLKDDSKAGNYSKFLDENNYLTTGQITLCGIGNGIFKNDTKITDVTLAESFNFIGNEAFANTNLHSIYMKNTAQIGNKAFKDCSQLSTVSFTGAEEGIGSGVNFIGAQAFDGTKIQEIIIPNSVTDIGPGAFANCTSLRKISFNISSDLKIWPFAFFDASALSEIIFPSSNDYHNSIKMGLACFALKNQGGSLTEFNFPYMDKIIAGVKIFEKTDGKFFNSVKNNYALGIDDEWNGMHEFMYNYLLANRSSLVSVTFPAQMGANKTYSDNTYVRIPDDTLAHCSGLEYVTMGSCSSETKKNNRDCIGIMYDTPPKDGAADPTLYDHDDDGHTLFQDVIDESFYVQGAGFYSNGSVSHVRSNTWNAQTEGSDSVPFKFYDDEGLKMEVPLGNFIACFKVLDENTKTAELVSYKRIDETDKSNIGLVSIGDPICGYKIIKVNQGCLEDIKKYIQVFEIKNGSLTEISDSAFEGCEDLREVHIGSSVTKIGASAFKGCIKLENIYFEVPESLTESSSTDEWAAALTIGKDAFRTNSEYLTFHGPIHSGYAPFEYAMDDNKIGSGGRNICYKTDEPTNLVVIRDNVTKKATLIDYSHYEDTDISNPGIIKEESARSAKKDITNYSILKNWEYSAGVNTNPVGDYSKVSPSEKEKIAIESALFVDLPDGIKSIDAKKYFSDATNNGNSFYYYNLYYYASDTGTNTSYIIGSTSYDIVRKNDDDYKRRNVNNNTGSLLKENLFKVLTESSLYIKPTDKTDLNIPTIPGLFSGYLKETDLTNGVYTIEKNTGAVSRTERENVGIIGKKLSFPEKGITRTMKEDNIYGNDNMLTFTAKSLTGLPDYAFYSCENLRYVDLGEHFGEYIYDQTLSKSERTTAIELPFLGCSDLDGIFFGGGDTVGSKNTENEYFVYANGILYQKGHGEDVDGIPEGKLRIVQVLENRGNQQFTQENGYYFDITSYSLCLDNDPLLAKVVSIADGAFKDNKHLKRIDLSATSIKKIPEDCFMGVTRINEVSFPETLNSIDKNAFAECDTLMNMYFANSDVFISDSAFDVTDPTKLIAIFHGAAYTDSTHKHETPIKIFADEKTYVDFESDPEKFNVCFYDYNGELLLIRKVEEGKSIQDSITSKLETDECSKRAGYKFTGWGWDQDGDITTRTDVVTKNEIVLQDIKEDRVLVAQYDPINGGGDGKKYDLVVTNGVIQYTSGASKASVESGKAVSVIANEAKKGYTFLYWKVDGINMDDDVRYNTQATFIMPKNDATITAVYRDTNGNVIEDNSGNTGGSPSGAIGGSDSTNGSNGSNGSDGTNGNNGSNGSTDTTTKYKVTVNYGSGTGEYAAGEVVSITAFAPETTSKVFSKWTSANSNVGFASATVASTTFVMPAAEVVVTANYKSRSLSDDDEEDEDSSSSSSSRRPSSNSVTISTKEPSGTTATTSSTDTNAKSDSGDKLYINKNGVSNKDLGTANVEGSTDNFIVRITESDEATQAAKDALRNRYGSLDGIAYFPMDISLYDSTGKNKIEDTYGLNVTVTMPIPDVLIQYGGNVKVGAADNGYLSELNTRFTTIDGIACMSFVPPHFSPYVIYVDTNNLVAGTKFDKTPQTGDPIHPKWFLAGGFACLSILLFLSGDRKKKVVLA